ncbi:protein of unknown function [Ruminococcaceae bacterium BL-6]|nr:protein of unknown function [Ruminococcaceae bacterium BL-6]
MLLQRRPTVSDRIIAAQTETKKIETLIYNDPYRNNIHKIFRKSFTIDYFAQTFILKIETEKEKTP